MSAVVFCCSSSWMCLGGKNNENFGGDVHSYNRFNFIEINDFIICISDYIQFRSLSI